MADAEHFMMGEYKAVFPGDRLYAENHMWLQPLDNTPPDHAQPGSFRVGMAQFAVRLVQDVYFLDWNIEPGTPVMAKQDIGELESSKAVSNIYTPLEGTVDAFNPGLIEDPSLINSAGYSDGWMLQMTVDPSTLKSAKEYVAFLATVWDKTQSVIKGQMNQ